MATKTRTKRTAFQRLVSIKSKVCKGTATKTEAKKVASAYVKETVKKGNKTKAEAIRSANKVLNKSCSTGIAGKKRKSPARKKAAVSGRKRRTTKRK